VGVSVVGKRSERPAHISERVIETVEQYKNPAAVRHAASALISEVNIRSQRSQVPLVPLGSFDLSCEPVVLLLVSDLVDVTVEAEINQGVLPFTGFGEPLLDG